jgi:Fic family protein
MIFNNYVAMKRIREMKGEEITADRILDLHRILTEDTLEESRDAGRFRTRDDVYVADIRDNSLLHVPPSCVELPERMQRLCNFANATESARPFVHPVIRAILLHFMIGYDHPFVDGNGRTARALFYWSMINSGYWLMEYASISHILRRAPSQYIRAYLHTETDGSDTTYFLLHQLKTIRRAINALHEYLAHKAAEQKEAERLLGTSTRLRALFNHRQIAVLGNALRDKAEVYRVESHRRTHNVVYQTARQDLLDLHKLGLMEKTKHGNAFVFYPPEDLKERIEELAGSQTN